MEKLKRVQEHFKFKLTDSWGECDFYIYEESTADGYSVYIASDSVQNINVNENIYYYDSDLSEPLIEHIECIGEKEETIYVDNMDAFFVEEAIEKLNELIDQ
tara:strand:+ start:449 stop:754 length:306 start_codon:yes stop_codon:yes gene_type:complete